MQKNTRKYIFDFDSTFIQEEAFDFLAAHVLSGHPDKERILNEFSKITDLSMEGRFDYAESLNARIKMIEFTKRDINDILDDLKHKVSPSFLKHRQFFLDNSEQIYIFSGGFFEIIWPIAKEFGIKKEHIFCNHFVYDHEDKVIGLNTDSLLAHNQGKVKLLQSLDLQGEIIVVGDGYNDYEMKDAGLVDTFFCFTETVQRKAVMDNADAVIDNIEGMFIALNIPFTSMPNHKKSLLLENIHPVVKDNFRRHSIEVQTESGALTEEQLIEKLKDITVLGIRSKTKITQKVIEACPNLHAIGAFCIGTNQIDLNACLDAGIAVFNAPFSNTRSVVELALAEIIMLIRGITDKSQSMHLGKWKKSSNNSFEVRGKKLGIIGYGNIGTQLSVLAENLGMNVFYYDLEEKLPLGNATPCDSMQECLEIADIVTLHVDGRASNKNLIAAKELQSMKQGAVLLNLSRGSVVNLNDLKSALDSGHILGSAIDVFPDEPNSSNGEFTSILQNCPNTILTPHIGGSTLEAQYNIGEFVSSRLSEYVLTGSTAASVNFPVLQLPSLQSAHRIIHIHRNVPGILAQINNILAEHKANIEGQYLKTNDTIGYVITDINQNYNKDMLKALKDIDHTIRVRILY